MKDILIPIAIMTVVSLAAYAGCLYAKNQRRARHIALACVLVYVFCVSSVVLL